MHLFTQSTLLVRSFVQKTALWCTVSFASLSAIGQGPASAVWPLLEDQVALVTGGITAGNQSLGSALDGIQFNSAYGTDAGGNRTTGWQRVGTVSSIPNPYNDNSYIQYSVTAPASLYFQVNEIKAEIVGGGTGTARLAVLYSLDNFATSGPIGAKAAYNSLMYDATRADSVLLLNGGSGIPVLTGQQILTFSNLTIDIPPGKTLTMRFMVWLTGTGSRHIGERNVEINGITTAETAPVSFLSTRAVKKNKGVQLEWSTSSEENLKEFVVEKSVNGKDFNPTASVLSASNGQAVANYYWFDAAPNKGNNFYRIKAIDLDGKLNYTSVLKVNMGETTPTVNIWPNPLVGKLMKVQLGDQEAGNYKVQLLNASGQTVVSANFQHSGATSVYTMNLPAGIQPGLYYVKCMNGNEVSTQKLMVR